VAACAENSRSKKKRVRVFKGHSIPRFALSGDLSTLTPSSAKPLSEPAARRRNANAGIVSPAFFYAIAVSVSVLKQIAFPAIVTVMVTIVMAIVVSVIETGQGISVAVQVSCCDDGGQPKTAVVVPGVVVMPVISIMTVMSVIRSPVVIGTVIS
jgi:hypothetical protein